MCSFGRTLLAFVLLHSVFQGQIYVLLLVFLDSYFGIPVSYNESDIFWGCFLEGLLGLHRTVQLQLLQCYWLGIDLDYCNIEWFALEMNRDHSVIFQIASKYCISYSFVDHDGYSISSEGFLAAVVDIMVN